MEESAPAGDGRVLAPESSEGSSDSDGAPVLDRPHIPMEVATGKSRKRVDAAKRRKRKQKSAATDALVEPEGSAPASVLPGHSGGEPVGGPPPAATRSDDPLGSAEARRPRRKKILSAAVGIFSAFASKDAGYASDGSGSDVESTCIGSDHDIIDLSDTSDSEWQCVRDVENKMEIEFEEFQPPPPQQRKGYYNTKPKN